MGTDCLNLMDTPASDSELMARLVAGDEPALSSLMQRWRERVASLLLKLTGDGTVAADLAQETFVKLYQSRHRFRPASAFSSYLFTIAVNLARNHARWIRRHPTVSIDSSEENSVAELSDRGQNPAATAITAEEVLGINRAFDSLPHDLREALALYIHEELSHAEIGVITGCTSKAVETRIYRARQILRQKIHHLRT